MEDEESRPVAEPALAEGQRPPYDVDAT
jgi:hypothetical protein